MFQVKTKFNYFFKCLRNKTSKHSLPVAEIFVLALSISIGPICKHW